MSGMLPLVPAPLDVRAGAGGPFRVTAATAVVAGEGTAAPAAVVAEALAATYGWPVPVVGPAVPAGGLAGGERGARAGGLAGGERGASADERAAGERGASADERAAGGLVVLALAGDRLADGPAAGSLPDGDEAYRLTAGEAGVRLTARTAAGLHRAAATLRQLLVAEGGAVTVPAVEVADAPRYGWRGLSIDVARHFLGPDDLRALVDLAAAYKLNTLHVHLTDDQGWRLDLPSRPQLVARSSGGSVGGDPGGCYTADDWRGLVAHAAARGVTLVPELDVPGHVNAALHALPELNPGGQAPPAYDGADVGFSGLRADLPATEPFLRDVFADLAALTPGDYLHLGGDEALSMGRDEYVALVGAALNAVRATGRRAVGWQEVAAAPLPPGTVLQYWDERADPSALLAAARAGARVLMSPSTHVYLDIKHTPDDALGVDWAGHTELRDAYDWDPATVLPGLDPTAVVGVEAAVWTETLRTLDDVTTMLLPRLAAVAEVAWSSSRDWDGFRARVAPHAAAWDRLGLAWHPSPQVGWRR